jgi:hypothetical protein
MKRLLIFGVLFLGQPAFGAKRTLTVVAVRQWQEVREFDSSYTTPGTPASTTCGGSVTDRIGPSLSVRLHCTNNPETPPEVHEVKTAQGIVVNVVEGEGQRFRIRCTSNWVGSNCAPLPVGPTFDAEIDQSTMWIKAHKNGDFKKTVRVKYQILETYPIDSDPIPQDSRYSLIQGIAIPFPQQSLVKAASTSGPSFLQEEVVTVFSGLPGVKITEGGVDRNVQDLPRQQGINLECVISRIGDKDYWASRKNAPMIRIDGGAFEIFVAVNGAGYVKVVKREMKAAASLTGDTEEKFDYVEHMPTGLKTVTYYGSRY